MRRQELGTYDVKQDGTSSLTAFVASEAGKMGVFFLVSSLFMNVYERPQNQLFDLAIQNRVLDQL